MAYNPAPKIEWDRAKDAVNEQRHGLSLSEAAELFTAGRDYLEMFDAAHSALEDRFIAVGLVRGRVIVIIWTERDDDTIRIISARRATARERQMFWLYLEHGHDT
ncbi:MAG: BrnT family toxin [Planctomycetota bacterium]|nr:BrnT family toxin [Planctomycetota bacterium]